MEDEEEEDFIVPDGYLSNEEKNLGDNGIIFYDLMLKKNMI